jgi:hypothetical protein
MNRRFFTCTIVAGAFLLTAALAQKPKPPIEQSLGGLTVNQSTLADAHKLYGRELGKDFGAFLFAIGPDCKLGVTANQAGVIEILDLEPKDVTKPPPYSAECEAMATGSGLKFGGRRPEVNQAFGLEDSAADPYGAYQLDNTALCVKKPKATPLDPDIQMTLSDEG